MIKPVTRHGCAPLLLSTLVLMFAGCAAQPRTPAAIASRAAPVVTRPSALSGGGPAAVSDPKAGLSLDEIEPKPEFARAVPSTQPFSGPPLEAVRLFARARIAMLDGNRREEGRLLDQAIALDPQSFELHKSLGDLYAEASDARAAGEWERAAQVEPDHLDLQIALGRAAMDEGDPAKAIEHLRLALQTGEYRRGDPGAGEAEFLLASVLQKEGYDRAALQLYERLMARLQHANFAERTNRQVALLLAHPDELALHIAGLYENGGAYGAALQLLRAVASRQPDNGELQARVIHDEALAGDRQRAVADAAEFVKRSHADARSVGLLSEVAGNDAVAALQKLRQGNPVDRDLVYALGDLLRRLHRDSDAAQVLADAAKRWPDDPRLLRRQAELRRDAGDPAGAAQLLVAALARRPDHEAEVAPIWDDLARPSPHGALRMPDVAAVQVAASEQPARLVLLARLAGLRHRDATEREMLARAVDAKPPFAPAFREVLALILADPARSAGQRLHDAQALADRAETEGAAGLASELRGQALLNDGRAQDAASAFAAAVKAGDRSPELTMNFAAALHAMGDEQGAQSLLWKVVTDHPLIGEAYEELYAIDLKLEEPQRAKGVLTVWLTADPDSAAAQRLQALDAYKARQYVEAERILRGLFDRADTDPQVLATLVQFYADTGRLSVVTQAMAERLSSEPWNSSLAIALADAYDQAHRRDDALRVLDGLRASATSTKDADLLYSLAGEYGRLNAAAQSEATLSDVLRIDPSFAGANNDLAYTWAEQGKNLGAAEQMVRKALTAEPDNLSFLDSMGWVLYKRGRFGEALRELQRAASLADPVVLDHLGDTLYRLGEQSEAALHWRQAVEKLGKPRDDDGEDRKKLREQLARKQQQLAAGRPVDVAPVAEEK